MRKMNRLFKQVSQLRNYSRGIGIRNKIQVKPTFLTGEFTMARLDLCSAYPIFLKITTCPDRDFIRPRKRLNDR